MSSINMTERETILSTAERWVKEDRHQGTPLSALAAQAGVSEHRLRVQFEDWPQIALAAFAARVEERREQTRGRPSPDSPLERVLAAAELLVLAADDHPGLLSIAMEGPSSAVARELTELFLARDGSVDVRGDLEEAAAAGEIPMGSVDAAERLLVGAVVGLVTGHTDHASHHRHQTWDLMQGGLLFGLSHLAALGR